LALVRRADRYGKIAALAWGVAEASAEGDQVLPPWALTLGWRCQQWGALPRDGGMLDQREREMQAMMLALAAHRLYNTPLNSDDFDTALYELIMDNLDD
jgi:hypothetical protein